MADVPDRGFLRRVDPTKTQGPLVVVPPAGETFYPAETEITNDTGNPVPISNTALDGNIPDEKGTWGYAAGTSGTVVVPANKRVLGIAASGGTSAASLTINGGDTVPILANQAIEVIPRGNLVAPTIEFTSTQTYFVEFVE